MNGKLPSVYSLICCIAVLASSAASSYAQTREETLNVVSGDAVSSLDPTALAVTRHSVSMSMNTYDRLVTFAVKEVDGHRVFDLANIRPELAESFEVSPDGLQITFKLRSGATFHDGSPVTVEDIKWSLDRAVSAKSGAASQLATGSLTETGQFEIVDESTIRITLPKPDRLALANLATPFARIINSKLAQQHATAEDPWADEWLKANAAGGGAYSVESFTPNQQVVLKRFDDWKSGPLPQLKRIVIRIIPEPATRANLVERGDADIAVDLRGSDVMLLEQAKQLKIVSDPQFNAVTYVAFNTEKPPFDNPKLRQAIAYALPYGDMMSAAVYGRGKPLFGATWEGQPPTFEYPQAATVSQDLEKAKKLMAEAGIDPGFKTSLTFSVASSGVSEPLGALLKESLASIGIEVELRKLPDAQLASTITSRDYELFTDTSSAMLPTTDYFFRFFYTGDWRWNASNYQNPKITELTEKARYEQNAQAYDDLSSQLIVIVNEDMPIAPLWQPFLDAVMAPDINGYTYWFHRQLDYRQLTRD